MRFTNLSNAARASAEALRSWPTTSGRACRSAPLGRAPPSLVKRRLANFLLLLGEPILVPTAFAKVSTHSLRDFGSAGSRPTRIFADATGLSWVCGRDGLIERSPAECANRLATLVDPGDNKNHQREG